MTDHVYNQPMFLQEVPEKYPAMLFTGGRDNVLAILKWARENSVDTTLTMGPDVESEYTNIDVLYIIEDGITQESKATKVRLFDWVVLRKTGEHAHLYRLPADYVQKNYTVVVND